MYPRIERPTPRPRNDVDRLSRLAAGAHGPEHLLEIHHVDIVVDHDGVAPEIGAGVNARGRVPDLARMARVALLDRDRVEET